MTLALLKPDKKNIGILSDTIKWKWQKKKKKKKKKKNGQNII